MRRIFSILGFATIPFLFSGCGSSTVIEHNQDTINKIVNIAAYNGAYQGLKLWAKKDNAAALEAATALSKNLKDEIIPYVNGGDLHTSAEIDEFINSSLFKNLPDDIKDTIVAAASILDAYLPVPSADKLKPEYLAYLKSFLTGLQSGAEKFATSTEVKQQRYWINGSTKQAKIQRSLNSVN